MVYGQIKFHPKASDKENYLDFEIQTEQFREKTCRLLEVFFQVDHRVKMKESNR